MATPIPTLSPYEKQNHSPKTQQSILYWRGCVKFGGRPKKRYNLYPKHLYQTITNPEELDIYYEKTESRKYLKYKDNQNRLRQYSRYYDIE